MRGILICLLIAVIGVFSQNYGNINLKNLAERLGPEYPQPANPAPIQTVDEVLPRLGAAAVDVSGFTLISGGLAYLPNDMDAAFENIDALTQQHGVTEVNLYSNHINKFLYLDSTLTLKHKRSFHVAQAISSTAFVIWGGGSSVVEGLDLESESEGFVEFPVTGEEPTATYGASSAYDYNLGYVIIFGGKDASGALSNDIHLFDPDFESPSWTKVDIPVGADKPSPRYGASFTPSFMGSSTSKYILYGGITAEGLSDEVWEFDLTTETWAPVYYNVAMIAGDIFASEFVEIDNDGSAARAFHTVFAVEDGYFFALLGKSEGKAQMMIMSIEEGLAITIQNPSSLSLPPVTYYSSVFSLTVGVSQFTFFGGIRDLNPVIDSRSLSGEVFVFDIQTLLNPEEPSVYFQRVGCYPGFVFDDILNVCVQPSEDRCSMCDNCSDLSLHKRQYVNKLKNKAIQRDYSGILKKCNKKN